MNRPLRAPGFDAETIPDELRARRQWVAWRFKEIAGRSKPTKVPVNPHDGSLASTTDPSTWGTFEEATACRGVDGVGFVFTPDDPYAGVDLDSCRDPETGELEPWADEIVSRLQTYTEISPSATGVHVIVRGSLPDGGRRKGNIEMYSEGRYFTMTGNRVEESPADIAERTPELAEIHGKVFEGVAVSEPASMHTRLTDTDLIARARSAANGAKFTRLWTGDITEYDSQSEADLALSGLLAFWTGPDQTRIDRLFRQSGLMRAKWDEQRGDQTYGQLTVATALEGRADFFGAPSSSPPGVLDLNSFMRTDAGNAEAFAAVHQGAIAFDHRLRRWLIWGGNRWQPDHVSEVRLHAKSFVRERLRAAAEIPDEEKRKQAVKHAVTSESRQRLDAILELAKSEPEIADDGEHWDAKRHLVAVENGVIDLNTGQLRAGRPDDRITLALPVPYRADAPCKRWERFLQEIFDADEELISFVQRAIGYSLTGDVSEHALFLLFGTGRNGKSVLLNTLRKLFGDYALNLPFSAFELVARSQLTPDLALLPGKRLVTSSETNDGARLNEARIKALTGADPITANPKYATPFEFTPVAKYWLAVNHLPVVRDDSEGFWQRVMLIRFERAFTKGERDPRLEERLAEELPGILAWIVRGALEWGRRGLEPPDSVRLATATYRAESDPLADFITARCIAGEACTVQSSALYADYSRWCGEIGMPASERLTHAAFGRRVGERFAKRATKQGKFYVGIGLASQRQGDGFVPSDGFDAGLQELLPEALREEEFWKTPSQPVTRAEPVTYPTCDEGCGSPVGEPGELCDACADAAVGSVD